MDASQIGKYIICFLSVLVVFLSVLVAIFGCSFYFHKEAPSVTNHVDTACGINPEKIAGGNEVSPYSIPWQVALVKHGKKEPFCGGTLISPSLVLTALHCTIKEDFDIFVGKHSFDKYDGTAHEICSVVPHPLDWDVSVVHLKSEVVMGQIANIACLPDSSLSGNVLDEKLLTVSGWGHLKETGRRPMALQKVTVPAISNEECNKFISIQDHELCAGNIQSGGVDSCAGDSGGPLTFEINGQATLVGVVSHGFGCAQPKKPGVYVRVTEVLDFINKELSRTCTATKKNSKDVNDFIELTNLITPGRLQMLGNPDYTTIADCLSPTLGATFRNYIKKVPGLVDSEKTQLRNLLNMWNGEVQNRKYHGLTFTADLKRCQKEQGVTELNALIGLLEDTFG